MNVKPGDLAILIRSKAGNEGIICKVLAPLGENPFYDNFYWAKGRGFCWLVEFAKPVQDTHGYLMKTMPVPDAWLRPVSGLPDEQHTEEDNKLEA